MVRALSTRAAACALGLAACLSGCGGTGRRLETEDRIPAMARLKAETLATPMRTEYAPGGVDAAGRPVRLAVHEWGTGAKDRVIVLLHGVLSDSWTWRFIVGGLLPFADVMAVDLPGSGQSDKPVLPAGAYSPTALAERVCLALRDRLGGRRPSTRVALVGHSLGAAVVVRALADRRLRREFEDVRRRVDRIVLLSAADVGAPRANPAFERIAEASALEFAAGEWLGILDRESLAAVLEGTMHADRTPREEVERLRAVLADPATRVPAQAQIRDAMPWTAAKRPDWPRIEALERDYANVDVPCLLVYGARDETLGASMGFKIASEIRGAQLRLVTHSMHMLPSEQPVVCAELIRGFVLSDGKSGPKIAWVDGSDGR